jgi:dihydrofolate synthase / folylpolyglutamate synthase
MRLTPLRTHRITPSDRDLFAILERHVPRLAERSVLAITSKIVALVEGRVVPAGAANKRELVLKEAERYVAAEHNKYDVFLTLKRGMLIATAGIDESNADGSFILWPADAQSTANQLRAYLARRFALAEVGVIITDSRTSPLRPGVTGIALAHSGFAALKDYVGKQDLFGRPLRMTKVNVLDALATAAVLVMGEGSEQTPLAVAEELGFVEFQGRDPTPAELAELVIAPEDDLYAPLLTSAPWERGGG